MPNKTYLSWDWSWAGKFTQKNLFKRRSFVCWNFESCSTAKNSVYVCKYQHALGRAQKPMAFCSLLSMRKQHGRYQCCSLFVSGGKNLRNTHGFGTPYTIIFDPGAAPATGQGEKKPLKYKRARESCWSKVFSCSSQKISTILAKSSAKTMSPITFFFKLLDVTQRRVAHWLSVQPPF